MHETAYHETAYKVGKLTITITENNKLSEQALKELSKTLERLFDENEEKKDQKALFLRNGDNKVKDAIP
jgi:hypothetical protein